MIEIRFANTAAEKYKYLINGIKKQVDDFLVNLSNGKIKAVSLMKLRPMSGRIRTFYFKKIGSLYIILAPEDGDWFIVDFLTESEFRKIRKRY